MKLRRAAAALLLLATLPLAACSGPDITEAFRSGAVAAPPRPTPTPSSPASPASSSPASPALSSPPGSASAPAGSGSATASVSPEFALLHRLRGLTTSSWPAQRDPRTGTGFALPAIVPEVRRTANGVAQRLYDYQLSKQTGLTVSFFRAPSAAAATALLRVYPDQLKAGFRAVGADDAAAIEQRVTTIDGKPAIMFRFSFTPSTVPQIPPVWLVAAVASGPNVAVLQTIVFPSSLNYDFLTPARRVQQRLVASFDAP